MQATLRLLSLMITDDSMPIVLIGESGTGKTLLAESLHRMSARRDAPFCALSLAAVDDALASPALFGHERGAYTGSVGERKGAFLTAHGGILFLDELGKASRCVQGQLLDALEYQRITRLGADRPTPVDVRLFAASNVPLDELVESGQMLQDMRHRFDYREVTIPPLRKRRQDIPALVSGMLCHHAHRLRRDRVPMVHPDLLTAIQRAAWPGNLRQLDHLIVRLLLEAQNDREITLQHCLDDLDFLPKLVRQAKPASNEIKTAALEYDATVAETAYRLGVSVRTIYRHRARHRDHADGEQ